MRFTNEMGKTSIATIHFVERVQNDVKDDVMRDVHATCENYLHDVITVLMLDKATMLKC